MIANVAIATGHEFLYVKFVFYCMQYQNLVAWSKLLKRMSHISFMLCRNVICWKQIAFFIFSGNYLLREGLFHIANSLKSFDFKLFFV